MTETGTGGLRRLDLDDPERGILAFAIGGKITLEEAQSVFDDISAAAAEGRKLRLYYELEGFPSVGKGVFTEKLKHLGDIFKTIERTAIVGDQRWLAVYAGIVDPITKMELKHFSNDEKDQAAAWILEPAG